MPNMKDGAPFSRLVRGAALLSAVIVAATACSGPAPADSAELKVVTTFTVIADMTRNVVGERSDSVAVASVTKVGAEIHEYEPTPEDLVRAQGADLILDNGLGLERWFEQFTNQIEAPTATLSAGIETIPITSGAYEGEANPHAWMSPDNAAVYVDNIRDALSELDPEHAQTYADNAATYKAEIGEVADFLTAEIDTLAAQHRALVTCEGAFSYLARDVGLTEKYLWPVNAETEGTPQQIASVVTFVSDNDVPAVFCETTVNDSAQRQVARETGARMGGALYVDSLSQPDGPVPSYLELLRYDAETIVSGLKGEQSP
ncbi:metal ABC transporter substrate-binding protein [Salinactinospora qingdaonensis]|uniref:Metal ABC transporter substrate-binding protein n=1 Tax=Salinactinospora qingdaonensis TaxID=702744 RepID=A0ABP7GF47_9ACTN